MVESGEIMSPSALADDLRENGWTEPEHFDEVLELVEQASVEVQHKIVQALIDGKAGYAEMAVYEGYAEPGYDDPAYLVLIDNWNQYDDHGTKLIKLLETCGCAIEWSDEWYDCQQCYKLVRTSADCYSWTPSYVMLNGCEPVCHECMSEDEGMQSDYVEQSWKATAIRQTRSESTWRAWDTPGWTRTFRTVGTVVSLPIPTRSGKH